MNIKFHPHALERMRERGITKEEAKRTITEGEQFPAKFGRNGFRRNFSFNNIWRGKTYNFKQVEVYAVKQDKKWVIITVIARYF